MHDLFRLLSDRSISCFPLTFVTSDIYFRMILDASVLPEPDSPDITIPFILFISILIQLLFLKINDRSLQLSFPCLFITLKADSAMAKMCGGLSNISLPFKILKLSIKKISS